MAALFARLGVVKEKLTLAIDYYHATQHITTALRPFTQKQLPESQRNTIFSQLKDDLYHGRIDALIATVTELAHGRKRVFKANEARQIHTFFDLVTMSITSRSRSSNPNQSPSLEFGSNRPGEFRYVVLRIEN